jgi:hypothetical protein
MNTADVIGLPEATFLSVENGSVIALSLHPTTIRYFRNGLAPEDLPTGINIKSKVMNIPFGK